MSDFRSIKLELLVESPTNPRKTFGNLGDLADSIREHGVLEPLLVRPRFEDASRPAGKFHPFEVVCGARRFRASSMAGIVEVPCMVREIDDATALELQLVENNQRSDVSALEEAQAFGELVKMGRDASDIAARLGRGLAYVTTRLRLLKLDGSLRTMLDMGVIHVGSAMLLAQLPLNIQREHASTINEDTIWFRRERRGKPWNALEVGQLIKRNNSRKLSLAVWDRDDEALLPAAGDCASCDKRTGVQPMLFAEFDEEDECLDVGCWDRKCAALASREEELGVTVVADVALVPEDFVDVSEFPEDTFGDEIEGVAPGISWTVMLGESEVPPADTMLVHAQGGQVRRYVRASTLVDLLGEDSDELAARLRDLNPHVPLATDVRQAASSGGSEAEEAAERQRAAERASDAAERALRARASEILRDDCIAVLTSPWPDTVAFWIAMTQVTGLAMASGDAADRLGLKWDTKRFSDANDKIVEHLEREGSVELARATVAHLLVWSLVDRHRLFDDVLEPEHRLFRAIGVHPAQAFAKAKQEASAVTTAGVEKGKALPKKKGKAA